MNKKNVSTFDREMQDREFKALFEKEYKEFALAEVLAGLMEESHKTVRGLAEEVGISPTIIQRVKSGQQKDLKVTNFLNIAEACGYHIYLEKGERRIELS